MENKKLKQEFWSKFFQKVYVFVLQQLEQNIDQSKKGGFSL